MSKITSLPEAQEIFEEDLIPLVQADDITKKIKISSFSKLYESQLKLVTEGGKNGWRLSNKIAENYGNTGEQAVDLSTSNASSVDYGAMGDYSLSTGFKTKALGAMSASFGDGTIALNANSIAMGTFNIGLSTDTVLEFGIGTDYINRKNSLEIYTDGTLVAPESSPELVQSRGGQTLVPVSYLLSAEFGNSLPTVDPGVPGTPWNNNGVMSISV